MEFFIQFSEVVYYEANSTISIVSVVTGHATHLISQTTPAGDGFMTMLVTILSGDPFGTPTHSLDAYSCPYLTSKLNGIGRFRHLSSKFGPKVCFHRTNLYVHTSDLHRTCDASRHLD